MMKTMILILITVITTADNYFCLTAIHRLTNKHTRITEGSSHRFRHNHRTH